MVEPYNGILHANKKEMKGTSLAVQWLGLCLLIQGVRVRSLVRELGFRMPRGQKTKNMKQKQYCSKFNKDFENGPHQKKKKRNEVLIHASTLMNLENIMLSARSQS